MQSIEFDLSNIPKLSLGAICIGKFDGFHLGHQHIIARTKQISGTLPCGILTFSPLPFIFFGKGKQTIYTQNEKAFLAQKLGANFLLTLNFNEQLSQTSGEEFIAKLASITKNIVVGKGFRFGGGQSCGENELMAWQGKHGYQAHILENVSNGDGKISSSMLRYCVQNGDFQGYTSISNCPFFALATVASGLKLASKIGFPTANCIISQEKIMPPFGVYASHISIDGQTYSSISNYGTKPTIEGIHAPTLETHIFGFNSNIYGKHVRVEFIAKIRDEQKFDNINQLQFQISQDIIICKKIHGL
jgi:riboflavin kinase/FMN adenylyltransferase